MGGLNWKNRPLSLARNSPEPVSAFLGGSLHFTWGWGGAVFPGLDQVTTQTGVPRVSELCMAFGVSNVG